MRTDRLPDPFGRAWWEPKAEMLEVKSFCHVEVVVAPECLCDNAAGG